MKNKMSLKSALKPLAVGAISLFAITLGSGVASANPIVDLMKQAADCSARATDLRYLASAAEVSAVKSEHWMDDENYHKEKDYIRSIKIYFKLAKSARDNFLRLTTEAQKLEVEAEIINQQIAAIQIATNDNTLLLMKLPENNKERIDAEAEMDRIRAATQNRHNQELEEIRNMTGWMDDFWNMTIRKAEEKTKK
jgi:hypothetical protein